MEAQKENQVYIKVSSFLLQYMILHKININQMLINTFQTVPKTITIKQLEKLLLSNKIHIQRQSLKQISKSIQIILVQKLKNHLLECSHILNQRLIDELYKQKNIKQDKNDSGPSIQTLKQLQINKHLRFIVEKVLESKTSTPIKVNLTDDKFKAYLPNKDKKLNHTKEEQSKKLMEEKRLSEYLKNIRDTPEPSNKRLPTLNRGLLNRSMEEKLISDTKKELRIKNNDVEKKKDVINPEQRDFKRQKVQNEAKHRQKTPQTDRIQKKVQLTDKTAVNKFIKTVKQQKKESIIIKKQIELLKKEQIKTNKKDQYASQKPLQQQYFEQKAIKDMLKDNVIIPANDLFKYYRLSKTHIEPCYLELIQNHLSNDIRFIDDNNPKYANLSENLSHLPKGQYTLNTGLNKKQEFLFSDVRQGQLGNCYFVASLAALAHKYPSLISKMFPFKQNPNGFYTVKLFIDGKWKNINLDDRFILKYNQFMFTKAHENKIWVPLIEKAWAKVHLSYDNIVSRQMGYALRGLTGAHIEYLVEQSEDKDIKKLVLKGFESNALIVCSGNKYLNSFDKDTAKQKFGIVPNHAYSILEKIVISHDKKDTLLLKLRNPWGKEVWKGQWSFNCKNWTDSLRKKFNYTKDPEDGTFYISWSMFEKYYHNINICCVKQHHQHSQIESSYIHEIPNYYEFTIQNSAQYKFTIYEEEEQKRIKKADYAKSGCFLIIMKKEVDKLLYYDSLIKNGDNMIYDMNLIRHFDKGTYIARIEMDIPRKKTICVFSSYSSSKVKIEQIPFNEKYDQQYTTRLINSFSQTHKGKIKNYSQVPEATREMEFDSKRGIGFIKIVNPSSDKGFESTITMENVTGIKLLKQYDSVLYSLMKPKTTKMYGFFVKPSMGYNMSESTKSVQ